MVFQNENPVIGVVAHRQKRLSVRIDPCNGLAHGRCAGRSSSVGKTACHVGLSEHKIGSQRCRWNRANRIAKDTVVAQVRDKQIARQHQRDGGSAKNKETACRQPAGIPGDRDQVGLTNPCNRFRTICGGADVKDLNAMECLVGNKQQRPITAEHPWSSHSCIRRSQGT